MRLLVELLVTKKHFLPAARSFSRISGTPSITCSRVCDMCSRVCDMYPHAHVHTHTHIHTYTHKHTHTQHTQLQHTHTRSAARASKAMLRRTVSPFQITPSQSKMKTSTWSSISAEEQGRKEMQVGGVGEGGGVRWRHGTRDISSRARPRLAGESRAGHGNRVAPDAAAGWHGRRRAHTQRLAKVANMQSQKERVLAVAPGACAAPRCRALASGPSNGTHRRWPASGGWWCPQSPETCLLRPAPPLSCPGRSPRGRGGSGRARCRAGCCAPGRCPGAHLGGRAPQRPLPRRPRPRARPPQATSCRTAWIPCMQ